MFILAITGTAFVATVVLSAFLLAAPRSELEANRQGRQDMAICHQIAVKPIHDHIIVDDYCKT